MSAFKTKEEFYGYIESRGIRAPRDDERIPEDELVVAADYLESEGCPNAARFLRPSKVGCSCGDVEWARATMKLMGIGSFAKTLAFFERGLA